MGETELVLPLAGALCPFSGAPSVPLPRQLIGPDWASGSGFTKTFANS